MKTTRRFRHGQSLDQPFLLPPLLTDWLPDTRPVDAWDQLRDQLNRTARLETYGPKGQPPYDPRIRGKVLVYGYARGIPSSRQRERACWEDGAFQVLSRNQPPDCWTRAPVGGGRLGEAQGRRHRWAPGERGSLQALRQELRPPAGAGGRTRGRGPGVLGTAGGARPGGRRGPRIRPGWLVGPACAPRRPEPARHHPRGGPGWKPKRRSARRPPTPNRSPRPRQPGNQPRPLRGAGDPGSSGLDARHRPGFANHAEQRHGVQPGVQRPGGGGCGLSDPCRGDGDAAGGGNARGSRPSGIARRVQGVASSYCGASRRWSRNDGSPVRSRTWRGSCGGRIG